MYVVSKKIDGKTLIFQSNPRHVTPQIDRLGKTSPVMRVSTYIIWGFQGDRWEKVHLDSKPRHVTHEIDHVLEKQTLF